MAQTPFPGYTADVTPESIKQQFEYAKALREGGGSGNFFNPVKHWSQGVSNIINALMGGAEARKADQMAAYLHKGEYGGTDPTQNYSVPGAPAIPGATPAPAPAPAATPPAPIPNDAAGGPGVNPTAMLLQNPTGGNLAPEKRSISTIESGSPEGNYLALGPRTRTGDRAYGRYQVMGANIPAWTASVLNYAETPQEFLHDKVAQDKVFEKKFGEYKDKYGPRGAALAWFGGEGAARGGNENITDRYISRRQYADRFMRGLNGGQPDTKVASAGAATPVGNRNDQLNPTDRAAVDAMYGPSGAQTGGDERSQIIAALQQGAQQGAPSGAGEGFGGGQQPGVTLPPQGATQSPQGAGTQLAAAGGAKAAPAASGNTPPNGIPATALPGNWVDPRRIPPIPQRVTKEQIDRALLSGNQQAAAYLYQRALTQDQPIQIPIGPDGKYGHVFVDPRSGAQFWQGNEIEKTYKVGEGVEAPFTFRYNPDGSFYPVGPSEAPPGAPGAIKPQSEAPQTQPKPTQTAQKIEDVQPEKDATGSEWVGSDKFQGLAKSYVDQFPNKGLPGSEGFKKQIPANPSQLGEWQTQRKKFEENTKAQTDSLIKKAEESTKSMGEAAGRARELDPEIKKSMELAANPNTKFGPLAPLQTLGQKAYNEVADELKKVGIDLGNSRYITAPSEAYVKEMAAMVLQSVRSLVGPNAGQFRVAELALTEKALGSQNMSREANQAVLRIVNSLNRRIQELNTLQNHWLASHDNVLGPEYEQMLDKFYRGHPILSDEEIENDKKLFDKEPAAAERWDTINENIKNPGADGRPYQDENGIWHPGKKKAS